MDSPLFLDITTITVDPAYVEAAAKRALAEDSRRPGFSLVISLVGLGLLLSVAGRQTRLDAPAATRARAALAAEAARRAEATDVLEERLASLRAEADALRDQSLQVTSAGRQLAESLAALDLVAGAVEVVGPGVTVTLRDAPPSEDEAATDDGRIRDRDLQEVVNALWAAGAEAIAVNSIRLSSLTAIREAGAAILVDYRPVASPYRISVVGDPDVVEPAFADSRASAGLRTLREVYGVGFDVRRRSRLTLPAAPARLRLAESAARRAVGASAPGSPQ